MWLVVTGWVSAICRLASVARPKAPSVQAVSTLPSMAWKGRFSAVLVIGLP